MLVGRGCAGSIPKTTQGARLDANKSDSLALYMLPNNLPDSAGVSDAYQQLSTSSHVLATYNNFLIFHRCLSFKKEATHKHTQSGLQPFPACLCVVELG